MPGPFEGLRVIDVTTIFVGPYAGQLLGDMGADVIKVEAPGGDSTRMSGPAVNPDMSSNFMQINRNKRSIALDLKTEGGRDVLYDLVKSADVFLHNMRPEPLARLRIDYPTVQPLKPDIVYCNVWGFGREGRYAGKAAYDDVIQGASGAVALQAFDGSPARYVPSLIADKTTGLFAAYAIVSALYHRLATGEGQEIEVPMFESMVSFMMMEHLWGESFVPARGRAGSERHGTPLRWPHATKDGFICCLPSSDKHWKALLKVMDRPDLSANPILKNRRARRRNLPQVMAVLDEILATRTTADWVKVLDEAGIPCMPISSLDDVVADPHLADVGFWREIDHPTEGRLRLMNPPYSFTQSQPSIRRPPPRFAEHTREILSELGYDDTAAERLIDDGAAIEQPKKADDSPF
ncbi:MAG: CoA transferase [Alphaproteobacteria bacterium]|nr:CoA transferase [Alphaproteobacteria bacterium]